MANDFLTLEGPEFSAGSPRLWESPEYEFYYDPNLGGFFKRLKQAVTPPRAIRKLQLKAIPKLVTTTVKKVVRYGGAAVIGTVLTASQRKKAFGLSDRESRQFETGAKVTRGIAAAVATAAVVYLALPAGAAAPVAAGTGSTAGGAGAGAGSAAAVTAAKAAAVPAWKALLMKGGAMLIKSQAAGMLYRITAAKSGQQTMESYDLNSVPQAEEMPNNEPVPVEPIRSEGSVFAPYVAGSGGLRPGGEEAISRRAGESEPYDPMALLDQATAVDESSIDPGDTSDLESITDKLTPKQESSLVEAFESGSLRSLMAQSRLSRASSARTSLSTSDGSYSLRGLLDGVRYGVIKRAPRFCPKAKPTFAPGSLTSLVRRDRSRLRVSRATANLASGVPGSWGYIAPKFPPGAIVAPGMYGGEPRDITPKYVDGWPTQGQYDSAKTRMAEITLNPDPNVLIADRYMAPAYERIIRDYELFLQLPEVTRKGIEVNQRRADAPGSKPSGRFATVKTAAEYVKKDESIDPFTSLFSLTKRLPQAA